MVRVVLKRAPADADLLRVECPDEVLERLFLRYRRAMAMNAAGQRDLRRVDDVLEARVVLYEHLVRTGWDPPAGVRRQLDLDALLLEQPPSLVPG